MAGSIVLVLVIVFFVVLAGFFAGAEIGIYRLSRLRLRLGIGKKRLSFLILDRAMRDSAALLLSMLIGTNLAHYLVASIVTFVLLSKVQAEHTAELLATVITAPTLFVFSELIPKSIFFYRSDSLMPRIAPALFAFHKLFSWCGAVPLLKNLSRFFAQLTGSPIPFETAVTAMHQPYIKAIMQDTSQEAFLSSVQTDIINRLAGISNISIGSVMVPINKVRTVGVDSDKSALLSKLNESAFTRLPVTDLRPANIIGFINIYEALSSTEQFTNLRNLIKPIRQLPADTVVSDAIKYMATENQKIVLVTRIAHAGREKPVGIVTMKDLVEELLGELTEW